MDARCPQAASNWVELGVYFALRSESQPMGVSPTYQSFRPQQMAGMPSACQLPVEYVISAWNLQLL